MNQTIYREFIIQRCYDKNNMRWDKRFFIDGYNGTYESLEKAKEKCDWILEQEEMEQLKRSMY